MRGARGGIPCAAVLLLLLRVAAPAGEAPGGTTVGGSIGTLAVGAINYENPLLFHDHRVDALSRTVLRLVAAGRPAAGLAFEVQGAQVVLLETFAEQFAGDLAAPGGRGPIASRGGAAGGTWNLAGGRDGGAEMTLERANLRLELRRLDLTVGRQGISLGTGWFWSPLDVFRPFDPYGLDAGRRAGVDAARLDVELGPLAGATVAAVAGREMGGGPYRGEDSSLLGRAYAAWSGWDGALQAGRIGGGYLAGGSLVGEAAGLVLRVEAAHTWADRGGPLVDHWAAVLGASRRVADSVILEAEYFHNGAGEEGDLPAALGRLFEGASLQMSRRLAAVVARVEITPLVRASASWVHSLSDSSDLAQGSVSISLSSEADLRIGVLVPRGERPEGLAPRSEFGSYPGLVFLELRRTF